MNKIILTILILVVIVIQMQIHAIGQTISIIINIDENQNKVLEIHDDVFGKVIELLKEFK